MSILGLASFALLVLSTSFVAGVFGMAGGMILMGGLIFIMPVASAMILHGVTQLVANGWRALMWRRHVQWRIVRRFTGGIMISGLIFSSLRLVPDERLVLIIIGVTPFLVLAVPSRFVPQVRDRGGAEMCGFMSATLQFLSGISGPMLDVFFVRSLMDRRVVIATKAACQVFSHLAKLIYFGLVIGGASSDFIDLQAVLLAGGLAIAGTSLSRAVLERLSDESFRTYTQWIVALIGAVYLGRGILGYI